MILFSLYNHKLVNIIVKSNNYVIEGKCYHYKSDRIVISTKQRYMDSMTIFNSMKVYRDMIFK